MDVSVKNDINMGKDILAYIRLMMMMMTIN